MIPATAPNANAREARQLLRRHRYGALSTLSAKFYGHPFGSITPYLVDQDGSLLILISTLAEHTKNIQADSRVSLITHDQRSPEIQTQGRVTVLGRACRVDDREQTSSRYLCYFPEAERYLAMHDFSFYRITPETLRYIGGFGHIHWVKAVDYLNPLALTAAEEIALITQLSASPAIDLIKQCRQQHACEEVARADLIGIDSDGLDLRADDRILRFEFPETASDYLSALQFAQQRLTQIN